MSAGISGVCLWEDSVWESGVPEAGSSFTGGDRRKSEVKERETQGF